MTQRFFSTDVRFVRPINRRRLQFVTLLADLRSPKEKAKGCPPLRTAAPHVLTIQYDKGTRAYLSLGIQGGTPVRYGNNEIFWGFQPLARKARGGREGPPMAGESAFNLAFRQCLLELFHALVSDFCADKPQQLEFC